ncbi:MAG: metal-dependent phosphohydrolase, partial [Chloroflexaceae bacterium]|nr:metal-dependent phosphohydrolase [Chloroflexaceae bacterium]
MFNPNKLVITAFVQQIREGYHAAYGGLKPDYADIIGWVGNMALENIANSNALYHNIEHTVFVTLVGQEILRGKHIRYGGTTPEDWLHFIISLVCHDIGYVKGICQQDVVVERIYATGLNDETV